MNSFSISILKYLLCSTALLLELPSLSPRLMMLFPLTVDIEQVDELLSNMPFHQLLSWEVMGADHELSYTAKNRKSNTRAQETLSVFLRKGGRVHLQLGIFAKVFVPGLFLSSELCHAARESPFIHLPSTWCFYSKLNHFH